MAEFFVFAICCTGGFFGLGFMAEAFRKGNYFTGMLLAVIMLLMAYNLICGLAVTGGAA